MSKWAAISLILLVAMAILIAFIYSRMHPAAKADIALYEGRGTWDLSVQALERLFLWMNYTIERVDADLINRGGLENFRALCIPGGNMYEYAQAISDQGKENIRKFIYKGGGYLGICGGACFASEEIYWRGSQLSMTPLGIFAGTAAGPIDEIAPYPDYTMCKVNIINRTHFITQSQPETEHVLYYWGPALTSNRDADVTILGNYAIGNQTAMVAFRYGQGKVFLDGTHPEIEEDSDRDGVAFGDELDDQGSEWDLLHRAAQWSVKPAP